MVMVCTLQKQTELLYVNVWDYEVGLGSRIRDLWTNPVKGLWHQFRAQMYEI